ncbi:MAG: glycogen synthase [Solirubrobacteraceae bacterium]
MSGLSANGPGQVRSSAKRRVALLTREYPPEVYGGAGVHVEYLTRELRNLVDLEVHCWGQPRPQANVHAYQAWAKLSGEEPELAALATVSVDLLMAAHVRGADLVHSHTWYAQFAGHLAKLIYGQVHVATVHSLEPLRPWKAEQLGGGYALSAYCERTALEGADAVIAVSHSSRADILKAYPAIDEQRVHVVLNGIDSDEYRPDPNTDVLERLGVDADRPTVVFVGRITRQKGVAHLLRAAAHFMPEAQLVLCAGAPDTPEIGAEVAALTRALMDTRDGVFWIQEMLPKRDVIQLLSHATVFVCPSIYEPLGIVNLEAMACETAVVASATGGIVEVVKDGETGLLVELEQAPGSIEPVDPTRFAQAFADRVNQLLAEPELAVTMGRAGRRRAVEAFSWQTVAAQTLAVYESATVSRR